MVLFTRPAMACIKPRFKPWLLHVEFNEAIKTFVAKRALEKKGGNALGTGLYQDEKILRNFAVFMRNCPIEDVTDENVIEWINLFKIMGYGEGTLKARTQVLVSFFTLFRRKGMDVLDPYLIPRIRLYYKKKRVCTIENYRKLLGLLSFPRKVETIEDAMVLRNRLMVSLLWNCGMRRTELANLDVSSIDVKRKTVTIKTAKSRGMRPLRTIPIDTFDKNAVEVLPLWLKARGKMVKTKRIKDPDALFIAYENQYGGEGKRMSPLTMEKTFVKMSKRAGIKEGVNMHSLRHRFGHGLNELRMNNSVISTSMGHSSLASSYPYTQPDDEELIEMLRKGRG